MLFTNRVLTSLFGTEARAIKIGKICQFDEDWEKPTLHTKSALPAFFF
jgi:hypothetical protein